MSDVILSFGSLTEANRAQSLLLRKRIRCRMVRLPHRPGGSCAFGVQLREADQVRAAELLRKIGIRPRSLIREADGDDLF